MVQGDLVDVAFTPQINEFRGERSVQMNVLDIRPACKAACSPKMTGYRELCEGTVSPAAAEALMPDRATLGVVWRYLAAAEGGQIRENPMCLCRKIVRWSGAPLDLGQLMTCLDIFADVGLIRLQRLRKYITICLVPRQDKADLTSSRTMQLLLAAKES